jgi:hypothetical protein
MGVSLFVSRSANERKPSSQADLFQGCNGKNSELVKKCFWDVAQPPSAV